jgi:sugar lactone lactonase YvrE
MSLIESQFTPSGMIQIVPIAVASNGNIYVNPNNSNQIRIYSNTGTFITSISTNDVYFNFVIDHANGIMYCAGVSTFGKLVLSNNTFSSVSSSWLNSVSLGPDGFIYAVTNSAYNILRINASTSVPTTIFTNSQSVINADAYGIFGGSTFDSKGFLYCITRGTGYIYKFDTNGNCLGLFSTVGSAYGNTFSLTSDKDNDIIYTSTTGSTGGLYRTDKYGKSTLHTTYTGQSNGLSYDPYTQKVYVTSNSAIYSTGNNYFSVRPDKHSVILSF